MIDKDRLPRHVAIIMDGNRRWAKINSRPIISGYRKGAKSAGAIISCCRELGIKYLTLFAFSMENWLRPKTEVHAIMKLIEDYLRSEHNLLLENNIRLLIIGDRKRLSGRLTEMIDKVLEETKDNNEMTLILALSYGGREEIIDAVRSIASDCILGIVDINNLKEQHLSRYLMTKGISNPELLIRTSGERRLSNFYLWQMANTELYFTSVLWPDFTEEDFFKAIQYYQSRKCQLN